MLVANVPPSNNVSPESDVIDLSNSVPPNALANSTLEYSVNTSVSDSNITEEQQGILKPVAVTERQKNYVYNVLMQYPEGELEIFFFNYEKNAENKAKLIDKKNRTFFQIATVSKLLILHAVRRMQSWM